MAIPQAKTQCCYRYAAETSDDSAEAISQNMWPGKWRCGIESLDRKKNGGRGRPWSSDTNVEWVTEPYFTWPTTLHTPSHCTGTDANQRRMEGRDETFVHEAIKTAVSWISKWQRKLLPILSWCDISCLRRFSFTKLHFIFAFGRYISRGLLSGWRRPSKCSRVSRIVTAGSIRAIILYWADKAGVIQPNRHRSGCGYSWQWTCGGISHSFKQVEPGAN